MFMWGKWKYKHCDICKEKRSIRNCYKASTRGCTIKCEICLRAHSCPILVKCNCCNSICCSNCRAACGSCMIRACDNCHNDNIYGYCKDCENL